MAGKTKFDGEMLDMDALEQIVAGAGTPAAATDDRKKAVIEEVPIYSEASVMIVAKPTIVAVPTVNDQPLNQAQGEIGAKIAQMSANDPAQATKALQSLVTETTAKLKTSYPGVNDDTANAMAWSAAYKAVFENNVVGAKTANVADAVKNSIASHAADVAKGVAAEVGYHGSLTTALTRASEVLALELKGKSAAAADEIRTKGAAAFEFGLDAAKGTGLGKSTMAAFDDPANIAKWKEAYANLAYTVMSPTIATPLKFLAQAMTDQATAKMIGLGDFPSEVKQTARAVVNAFDGIEKAFVDVYKSGFLAGVTMGLDVKGIINIGQNCADLGKAMVKGDTAAMANAAKELVTDMMYDLRDGYKTYYVDAPTKAFNYTKDITVMLMDDLGATPYINLGAKAVADTFTDLGNAAAKGSMNAINVIGDFAKNEMPAALGQLETLAKGGLNTAIKELEEVANTGVRAATSALLEAARVTGAGAAIDALSNLIKSNVPGALSEVSKAASQFESATWALRKAAEQGSTAALNEVSNLAKTVFGDLQRICVDAVQQSVLKGVPGAVDKMADLVTSGTRWAQSSAEGVVRAGGAGAMQLVEKMAQAFGTFGNATSLVEFAAKNLSNEVGRAAITHLENISKSASQFGGQAIDSLKAAMLAGGAHADRAWDAVSRTAETVNNHSSKAIAVMTDLTRSGQAYASQSFDSLKRVANSGGTYVNQAVDGLSTVARAGAGYANQAIDELKRLAPQVKSAATALESVAKDVGGYAGTAWKEVDGAFRSGGAMDPTKW